MDGVGADRAEQQTDETTVASATYDEQICIAGRLDEQTAWVTAANRCVDLG